PFHHYRRRNRLIETRRLQANEKRRHVTPMNFCTPHRRMIHKSANERTWIETELAHNRRSRRYSSITIFARPPAVRPASAAHVEDVEWSWCDVIHVIWRRLHIVGCRGSRIRDWRAISIGTRVAGGRGDSPSTLTEKPLS